MYLCQSFSDFPFIDGVHHGAPPGAFSTRLYPGVFSWCTYRTRGPAQGLLRGPPSEGCSARASYPACSARDSYPECVPPASTRSILHFPLPRPFWELFHKAAAEVGFTCAFSSAVFSARLYLVFSHGPLFRVFRTCSAWLYPQCSQRVT